MAVAGVSRPAGWRILSGMGSLKTLRRPVVVLAAVFLVGSLATACGDDKPGEAANAGQNAVSMPGQAPDPDQRCSTNVDGEKLVLSTEDGVKLAAGRFGTGSHGVVLLPQRGSDMCGWSTFIPDLVQRGMQVLTVDLRCNGYSDCPADDNGDDMSGGRDYTADAGAAIAELHRNGATKVAVMGASLGAATAFVAGGRYPDRVSAVVALSLFSTSFSVSQSDLRSASDAAPHVTAPILICLSTEDSSSIQEGAAQTLIDAAPSKAESDTVVREGYSHGWDMLPDQTVRAKVLDFLAQHT
jgi:pimeloyl-ACP methyl ester carboxylesterase